MFPCRAGGQVGRAQRGRQTERRKAEGGEEGKLANPNISPNFSTALLPLTEKCYDIVFGSSGSEVREPGLKS